MQVVLLRDKILFGNRWKVMCSFCAFIKIEKAIIYIGIAWIIILIIIISFFGYFHRDIIDHSAWDNMLSKHTFKNIDISLLPHNIEHFYSSMKYRILCGRTFRTFWKISARRNWIQFFRSHTYAFQNVFSSKYKKFRNSLWNTSFSLLMLNLPREERIWHRGDNKKNYVE